MKDIRKFVLSSTPFIKILDAEKKVTGWWTGGDKINKGLKLYEVKSTYDLKLKFVKRKEKK